MRGAKISIEILVGACPSGEMPSLGYHQVIEPVVAHRRSESRLADERLGLRKAMPCPRGKLVPITGDFLHYLEPTPHAVKRKNGERGSDNGPSC